MIQRILVAMVQHDRVPECFLSESQVTQPQVGHTEVVVGQGRVGVAPEGVFAPGDGLVGVVHLHQDATLGGDELVDVWIKCDALVANQQCFFESRAVHRDDRSKKVVGVNYVSIRSIDSGQLNSSLKRLRVCVCVNVRKRAIVNVQHCSLCLNAEKPDLRTDMEKLC